MTFFFDNNFSPVVPAILQLLGHAAIHLRDHFAQDDSDEDWLPLVAERGWLLVTADQNLWRRPAQRQLLDHCHLTSIFVRKTVHRWGLRQKVIWFIKHWESVEAKMPDASSGALYEMQANGKLRPMGT